MKTKLTKEKLAEWVNRLQTDSVECEIEFHGGGASNQPGRSVIGYTVILDIAEEFPDSEKPALSVL